MTEKVTKNNTKEHLENMSKYDLSLDLPIALRKGTRSCTKTLLLILCLIRTYLLNLEPLQLVLTLLLYPKYPCCL